MPERGYLQVDVEFGPVKVGVMEDSDLGYIADLRAFEPRIALVWKEILFHVQPQPNAVVGNVGHFNF